jgi:hypothetical protein
VKRRKFNTTRLESNSRTLELRWGLLPSPEFFYARQVDNSTFGTDSGLGDFHTGRFSSFRV